MPNDAKLGMVVGVGLVMTVAVVFFRKDLITRRPAADPAAAATVNAARPSVPPASRGMARPARARTASQIEAATRIHVVQEGETLESLARHYYGDAARAPDLVRANPGLLMEPGALTPGITLIVPELP